MKKNQVMRALNLLMISVIAFLGFGLNAFSVVTPELFENYNLDSQILVYDSISLDDFPREGYGLVVLNDSGVVPYPSNVGIQGYLFHVVESVGCSSWDCMQKVNALLFSVSFAFLILFMYHKVSVLLAALIFIGFLGSPWITLFAKNIYWIPFSWLLPSLVVMWLLVERVGEGWSRKLALPLLYSAFTFKFLAGYEYATSIILFTSTIPLLLAFSREYLAKPEFYKLARMFVVIFSTGIVGFLSALIIHANLRGNSITNGLIRIYNEDVKRRTYGNSLNFPEVYTPSLDANAIDVLRVYILDWQTDVLDFGHPDFLTLHLGKNSLSVVIFISLSASIFRMLKTRGDIIIRLNRSGMLQNMLALAAPISWFILAKSHSYIHTHLNFILWYVLTLPVLFWTLIMNTRFLYHSLKSRL